MANRESITKIEVVMCLIIEYVGIQGHLPFTGETVHLPSSLQLLQVVRLRNPAYSFQLWNGRSAGPKWPSTAFGIALHLGWMVRWFGLKPTSCFFLNVTSYSPGGEKTWSIYKIRRSVLNFIRVLLGKQFSWGKVLIMGET